MKSDQNKLSSLQKEALKGNYRALGKLLTLVEADWAGHLPFLLSLKKRKTPRIGITGPPGAGKSTLVNACLEQLKSNGKRIAVLAVDPSSPFSGGAILGDRVRMSQHAEDEKIFVRSVSARGHGGGISAATGAMLRVLELASFDLILVETVGVGQSELEIMNLVDQTLVVLVPESGDEIQAMKSGLLEIADGFVVNKSDRSGAEILAKELELQEEARSPRRPVFRTVATQKQGILEVCRFIEKVSMKSVGSKLKGELKALLLWEAQKSIEQKLAKTKVMDPYLSFSKIIPKSSRK